MEPFSRDELVVALRPALEEADAVEIADGAYAVGEETWARCLAAGYPADEGTFVRLAAMNLSEDFLILLAMASEKGARTIPLFRAWRQRRGRATDEERARDDAQWAARHALLAEVSFVKDGE
jgi:hypothetical protein